MSALEFSHQKSLSLRQTSASSRDVCSSLLLNFCIISRYCSPLRFSLSLLSISSITLSISIYHPFPTKSFIFSIPKTIEVLLSHFACKPNDYVCSCEIIITITAIMIKRNAERNVLNDKYAFKYRTKQYGEECHDDKTENRRIDLDLSHDENGRLTSNNKKYHQYKEEKDIRHRRIEVRNQSKVVLPLAEIKAEQIYTPPLSKERVLLKRQYQYEANDKVQAKQAEARPIVLPQQSERKKTSTINQHSLSFNQMIDYQPLRRRGESQSIQKETRQNERIDIKYVRPNFDADVFSTERKHQRRSYQKLNYNLSQNIKLARDYDRLDEPTDRTTNFPPLHQQITPNLTQYRPQSSFGAEQMSLKLKQISSFNNQINQRIKSIIGSFMSLKEKL